MVWYQNIFPSEQHKRYHCIPSDQKYKPTLNSAEILSSNSVPLGQFLFRKDV